MCRFHGIFLNVETSSLIRHRQKLLLRVHCSLRPVTLCTVTDLILYPPGENPAGDHTPLRSSNLNLFVTPRGRGVTS